MSKGVRIFEHIGHLFGKDNMGRSMVGQSGDLKPAVPNGKGDPGFWGTSLLLQSWTKRIRMPNFIKTVESRVHTKKFSGAAIHSPVPGLGERRLYPKRRSRHERCESVFPGYAIQVLHCSLASIQRYEHLRKWGGWRSARSPHCS